MSSLYFYRAIWSRTLSLTSVLSRSISLATRAAASTHSATRCFSSNPIYALCHAQSRCNIVRHTGSVQTQLLQIPACNSSLQAARSLSTSVLWRTCPLVPSANQGADRALLNVSKTDYTCTRSKISFSFARGKPKTVKGVIRRFYRLDWGIWIRPRASRANKLWSKSERHKNRLRRHVFCNRTQSKMFDKMVTPFWKKKKYYVDDPYEPYQKRTNIPGRFPEIPKFFP